MKTAHKVLLAVAALGLLAVAGCKQPVDLSMQRNRIFLMGRLLVGQACDVRLIWRKAPGDAVPATVTADLSQTGGEAAQEFVADDNNTGIWRWSGKLSPSSDGLKTIPVSAISENGSQQTTENTLRVYKPGTAIAISAGVDYALALKADGTVVAWHVSTGETFGLLDDLDDIVAIGASEREALALRADGTVYYYPVYGDSAISTGLTDIVAIATGESGRLALKADGTVESWGSAPSELANVIALSAGYNNSLALKADGTLAYWPKDHPAKALTDVVAVSAGFGMDLVLLADGTVVPSQMHDISKILSLPFPLRGLRAVAIAAGFDFCAALKENGDVVEWWPADLEVGTWYTMTGASAKPVSAIAVNIVVMTIDGSQGNVPYVAALASDGSVTAWYDTLSSRVPLPVPDELK